MIKQQNVRVKNFICTCVANFLEECHTQYNVINFRNQTKYKLDI